MKVLLVHTDFLNVDLKGKALKSAPEPEKKRYEIGECLVSFTAVEEGDSPAMAKQVADSIADVCKQINVGTVVLYPLVHLTSRPSRPDVALSVLKAIGEELANVEHINTIIEIPFGWYKAYELSCKGHPLSELSREFKPGDVKEPEKEDDVSESLKAEDELVSRFYVLTPEGDLVPVEEFDFQGHENLLKFVEYETKKSRAYEKEPVHIRLMKEHDLVEYEPGSDPGNFRWLPKGCVIKRTLEQMISLLSVANGAMEVETPIMYDYEHPALKKYLNRFPARQYVVLSDDKKLFLRFAACFGQFLTMHDMVISHKQLPLKMYELTRYSFRREQRGELSGLKRLRAFTMPDMHTLCANMEQAKQAFNEQYDLCLEWNKHFGIDFEVAFRCQTDFFEENREWYVSFVKRVGKPILLELFDKRYAYFITKFEFNFIDSKSKATALSTVQIDVENAETYDITYVDEDGSKKRPIILHASISGALERVLYAILEREGMKMERGEKANYPLFLAPTQIRLIPIGPNENAYVEELWAKFANSSVRIDIDDTADTLSKKIMRAEKEWVPYVCVIGPREIEEGTVSVSIRETGEKKTMSLAELVDEIEAKCARYPFVPLSLDPLLSRRPKF